jgi:hypothetical protein
MDDSDIYASLMGEPPKGAQLSAIANALRNRSENGRMLSILGDPQVSAAGDALTASAMPQVKQFQDTRQKDTDNGQQRDYQTGMLKHLGNMEGITKRGQDLAYDRATDVAYINLLKQNGADAKAERQADQDTQKLSSALVAAKIPLLDTTITTLNNTMRQYSDAGKPLPGMGYAKNLPGAGILLSPEGKVVKSQLQAVANDLLVMYSGLAVTVPESERRSLEMMTSGKFSEADFRKAWPEVVQRYNSVRGAILGRAPRNIQERYFQQNPNGGSPDPIMPVGGTPMAGQNPRSILASPASAPKKRYEDMSDEEIAAAHAGISQ